MLFVLLVLAGVVPSLLWAWKAARSTRDGLLTAIPVVVLVPSWAAVGLFTSGLVNLALCLLVMISCIAAILRIGVAFRDRAMKEAFDAAE